MAIRKHKNGSFVLDVSKTEDGRVVRIREFFKSWDEARKLETAINYRLANGESICALKEEQEEKKKYKGTKKQEIVRDGPTLKEMAEATINHCWRGTSNEKTATINIVDVVNLLGEEKPFKSLTMQDIDWLVSAWRDRGLANGTINRKLAALSKMIGFAKSRHNIGQRLRVEYVKDTHKRIRFFSDEERAKIIEYFKNEGKVNWMDYFTVLIDTGARCGELENLTIKDFCGDRIHIWTNKGDLPRTVPLTKRAQESIARCIENLGHGQYKPFEYASANSRRHAWNCMKAFLGLERDCDFVPHACRHDCATRLLKQTGNLVLVQRWLGHKTIEMTLRYAHLVTADLERARDLIDLESSY